MGVLAGGAALFGDSVHVFGIAFAWLAALALVFRMQRARRDNGDLPALIVVLPTWMALAAATWAHLVHEDHAVGLAAFAGLCGAATLVVEWFVEWSREPLRGARAQLPLSPELRVDFAAPVAARLRRALLRAVPLASMAAGAATLVSHHGGPATLALMSAVAILLLTPTALGAVADHYGCAQLRALSNGILYKDAHAFDAASRADVAVVCLRGTLLMGEPEVVTLETFGAFDPNRLLALAAGAESASTHPFASAILRAARTRGERPENVRSVTVRAGMGVTGLATTGDRIAVGSRMLLLQERVSVAIADARVSALEAQGRNVLLVALGGKLVGLLGLQDRLRRGARAGVQSLLDARIEPVLLTGEARATSEAIGGALDIDHVRPEVLPEERAGEVRALAEGGHVVAVIGHPSADRAALGAADVAIALGAGSATRGEWAVVISASDDVRDAARALRFAREAREGARVAVALGMAPGVAAALAVAFGVAPLVLAPFAFVGASLAALFHARRMPAALFAEIQGAPKP